MLAAAILAGGLALGDFSADPDRAALMTLPRDVRVFIDRRMGCNHFAGEEPYDKARARDLAAAMRKLRCEALGAQEARLQRRYTKAPAVLNALIDTRDALW